MGQVSTEEVPCLLWNLNKVRDWEVSGEGLWAGIWISRCMRSWVQGVLKIKTTRILNCEPTNEWLHLFTPSEVYSHIIHHCSTQHNTHQLLFPTHTTFSFQHNTHQLLFPTQHIPLSLSNTYHFLFPTNTHTQIYSHINFICLDSWFHLAVSFVNICKITLLLIDKCWSLSWYVVTFFVANWFWLRSIFLFSNLCIVTNPTLFSSTSLSTPYFLLPSPTLHINLHQMRAEPFLQQHAQLQNTQFRDVIVCVLRSNSTPTLQIQRNQMAIAALPNRPTKRRDVQIVQIVSLQTQRFQLPEFQSVRGTVFQKRSERFSLDFVVYSH